VPAFNTLIRVNPKIWDCKIWPQETTGIIWCRADFDILNHLGATHECDRLIAILVANAALNCTLRGQKMVEFVEPMPGRGTTGKRPGFQLRIYGHLTLFHIVYFLRFARTSERFIHPFGYLRAAHWAETDYGLSTSGFAVLPEGKGKSKGNISSVTGNL